MRDFTRLDANCSQSYAKRATGQVTDLLMCHLINQGHVTDLGPRDPPVSMLSLTMQFPLTRTASHCMTQPWRGTSITSPGTSRSDGTSRYSTSPPVAPSLCATDTMPLAVIVLLSARCICKT